MPTPTLCVTYSLGTGTHAREHMRRDVMETVRNMGFRITESARDNNECNVGTDRTVAQEFDIAGRDVDSLKNADGVLCVVSSAAPDTGVMVEVGMAIALHKPVFVLNDDARFRPNDRCLPMNLMLFCHARPDTWERYYYTSIDGLRDPQKALHKWITHLQTPIENLLRQH